MIKTFVFWDRETITGEMNLKQITPLILIIGLKRLADGLQRFKLAI